MGVSVVGSADTVFQWFTEFQVFFSVFQTHSMLYRGFCSIYSVSVLQRFFGVFQCVTEFTLSYIVLPVWFPVVVSQYYIFVLQLYRNYIVLL